ncbi:uncharacterized protein LOC141717067 [Apium graveolens]|uniref:uncharacterized protein LOC141717067 n=1 Tax=Apium graveolens TaxID=4045 RepID=UPI003D7ABCB2
MLWDQLDSIDTIPICNCTHCTCTITAKLMKSQEDRRLVEFLMKLTDGYEVIRGSILIMNPLPSISHAYRLLEQEENHKKLSHVSTGTYESMAFVVNRRFSQERFKPQLTRNSYSDSRGNKPSSYYCDHCNMSGHTIQRCYKLIGYPQSFRTDKDKGAAAAQVEDVPSNNNNHPMTFTNSQYMQILHLLGKEKSEESMKKEETTKSAHVAGAFDEATSSW